MKKILLPIIGFLSFNLITSCSTNENEEINAESLTINLNELTLSLGETKKLTASISPPNASQNEILWQSTDVQVAKVSDEGVVSAISPGNVTITAYIKGTDITQTMSLTVNNVPVGRIVLNPEVLEITLGETKKITAEILSSRDTSLFRISWKSNDVSIVRVDSKGLVNAIREGVTTITASSEDLGISSTCTVNVTKPQVVDPDSAVTGVVLNRYTLSLKVGQTTSPLEATVEPESRVINQKVTWSVQEGQENIVSINQNGEVTGIALGVARVIATSQQDTSKKSFCEVSVSDRTIEVQSVSVDKTEYEILSGTSLPTSTIGIAVQPPDASDSSTIFEFDREGVAAVNNIGEIYGQAPGNVNVKVIATTDPSKFATFLLRVNQSLTPITSVVIEQSTGVTLDSNSNYILTMRLGDTVIITASVQPKLASNRTVTWAVSSSAASIVNEDIPNYRCTIKAELVGSVILTATSNQDSSKFQEVSINITN